MNGRQAAALAERYGFALFPLRYKDKKPLVKDWERRACHDPPELLATWPNRCTGAGIACGPSEIVGLDLDPPGGIAQFRELAAGREVPPTFTARTPRDGLHLDFAAISGRAIRNSAKRLAPDIDIRGVGGFLVAPGSIIDSRAYAAPVELVNRGRYVLIDDRPPAPLPEWLADLILFRPEPIQPATARPIASSTAYGLAALSAEADKLRGTLPGSRGWQQNATSFRLGQLAAEGLLDAEAIFAAILQASTDNGLLAKDGEADCAYHIRRAIRDGMASPRRRAG